MEGEEINLGKAMANIGIVLTDAAYMAVEPDPRYVSLSVFLSTRNLDYSSRQIRHLELEKISEEDHP